MFRHDNGATNSVRPVFRCWPSMVTVRMKTPHTNRLAANCTAPCSPPSKPPKKPVLPQAHPPTLEVGGLVCTQPANTQMIITVNRCFSHGFANSHPVALLSRYYWLYCRESALVPSSWPVDARRAGKPSIARARPPFQPEFCLRASK